MFYAVSLLHMPGGETKNGAVLEIVSGIVKDIYPFVKELPSMRYVPEVFLSPNENVCNVRGLNLVDTVAGPPLFAYRLCDDGRLAVLE